METVSVSVQEAAKALGVCNASVYRLIKSGSLRSFSVGKRILLFRVFLLFLEINGLGPVNPRQLKRIVRLKEVVTGNKV
jgi:excisionase family DNA binding protein